MKLFYWVVYSCPWERHREASELCKLVKKKAGARQVEERKIHPGKTNPENKKTQNYWLHY